MNIYRALHCVYKGVALREKDPEGKTLKIHHVEFINGFTSPNFMGGTLVTKDPVLIKLLDESPRNVKNGGSEWKLEKVIQENTEEQPQKVSPKKQSKPVKESVNAAVESTKESNTETNSQVTVYEDITTVQFAGAKLRELDPSIKTIDIRTRAQINAVAAKLNVSFPNL